MSYAPRTDFEGPAKCNTSTDISKLTQFRSNGLRGLQELQVELDEEAECEQVEDSLWFSDKDED